MIRSRRLASLLVCLPVLVGLAPPSSGQLASTAAQRLGAKIWVDRYQEIEEYLRTGECVSIEVLGPDRLRRCTLRPGGLAARMAWISVAPGIYRGFWESYKANIAAYEIDRLLKMDMVPPTVERQLQGNKGAATLWVENIVDLAKAASPDEANRAGWEKQLVQMAKRSTPVSLIPSAAPVSTRQPIRGRAAATKSPSAGEFPTATPSMNARTGAAA